MSIQIQIPVTTIYFSTDQFEKWKSGIRDICSDPYCRGLPNAYGFGENLVGNYFESLGYKWIHHDYNVFGGNRPGKYPLADDVLIRCLGESKFNSARLIYKSFKNIEEPDLMIYKPDYSEIRFAESKRVDTRDRLRSSQVRGLALLSLLLDCKVDVFEVAKEGNHHDAKPVIWDF